MTQSRRRWVMPVPHCPPRRPRALSKARKRPAVASVETEAAAPVPARRRVVQLALSSPRLRCLRFWQPPQRWRPGQSACLRPSPWPSSRPEAGRTTRRSACVSPRSRAAGWPVARPESSATGPRRRTRCAWGASRGARGTWAQEAGARRGQTRAEQLRKTWARRETDSATGAARPRGRVPAPPGRLQRTQATEPARRQEPAALGEKTPKAQKPLPGRTAGQVQKPLPGAR